MKLTVVWLFASHQCAISAATVARLMLSKFVHFFEFWYVMNSIFYNEILLEMYLLYSNLHLFALYFAIHCNHQSSIFQWMGFQQASTQYISIASFVSSYFCILKYIHNKNSKGFKNQASHANIHEKSKLTASTFIKHGVTFPE